MKQDRSIPPTDGILTWKQFKQDCAMNTKEQRRKSKEAYSEYLKNHKRQSGSEESEQAEIEKEAGDSDDDGKMTKPAQTHSDEKHYWRDCPCGARRLWQEERCACSNIFFWSVAKHEPLCEGAFFMNEDAKFEYVSLRAEGQPE